MTSTQVLCNVAWISSRSSSNLTSLLLKPSVSISLIHRQNVAFPALASIHQQQKRSFSSADMFPRRGFPSYSVFNPTAVLHIKAILPTYKRVGNDAIIVDRRGKLILEFTPRSSPASPFQWNMKTNFALSVEEVAYCMSQIPGGHVELVRRLRGIGETEEEEEESSVTQIAGDFLEKVLTIKPGDGGTVCLSVDHVKNGFGGQNPNGISPIEITMQVGEVEVMKSIFQTSIPYLLGWNATMDLATAAAISRGLSGDTGKRT